MTLIQLLKYSDEYVAQLNKELDVRGYDISSLSPENLVKLGVIAGFKEAKKEYAINDVIFDLSLLSDDGYSF